MAYSPISNPMNIVDPDGILSGTITAADVVVGTPAGTGVALTGTATAGSTVVLSCPGGDSAWFIGFTGTFGGTTVYFEESIDSTNGIDGYWIVVNGRQTGIVNTVLGTNSTVTNSMWRGNTAGAKYLRVRAVGGSAISITVTMRISAGPGALFLNASTPAGNNVMGKIGLDQTIQGTTNLVAVSAANTSISARPDGFLRTVADPTTLLFDTFETLDTTNTWTLGGTNVPTGASGVLTMNAGATINLTSYAQSKPSFIPGASAYLQFATLVTLDGAASTGTNRFWGVGVISAPTVTVPITNGTVFEVDTTGTLFGSVYSNSTRTQTATLTKPTDAGIHRYAVYYKASRVYFELDNIIVGTLPFPNPAVSALSVVIGQINSGAVTGTNTLTSTLLGLGDTARNATKLADGTYPWRTATIKPASTAVVATDTALAVGIHPTSNRVDAHDSGVSVTGNYTAVSTGSTIVLDGRAGATFGISGTWVGTITFTASNDGGVTYPTTVNAQRAGDNTISQTAVSSASNDIYRISGGGFTHLRAFLTAYTSGTVTITGVATTATNAMVLSAPIPAGNNIIGTTNTIPGLLPLGTNRSGTITTGGAAQVLTASNAARTGLSIQNTHATADLWLTEDGATTAALNTGYRLTAGSAASINTRNAISIWGATTGQTFAATEF